MSDKEERAQSRQKFMQFKAGETVRIRQWDDMLKEYGEDGEGDIATRFAFTKPMRKFCGMLFTIREIGFGGRVSFKEDGMKEWSVSVEMIERIGKGGKAVKETPAKEDNPFAGEIAGAERAVKDAKLALENIRARARNYIGKIGKNDIRLGGGGPQSGFRIGCQSFTTEEVKEAWEKIGKRMRWKLR